MIRMGWEEQGESQMRGQFQKFSFFHLRNTLWALLDWTVWGKLSDLNLNDYLSLLAFQFISVLLDFFPHGLALS